MACAGSGQRRLGSRSRPKPWAGEPDQRPGISAKGAILLKGPFGYDDRALHQSLKLVLKLKPQGVVGRSVIQPEQQTGVVLDCLVVANLDAAE